MANANRKEHMNKHLVSAKKWMSRAEKSFETEKDIRGELDLFLAQAELAHIQKTSRIYRLTQYPFFKQSAALFAALLVVAFGLGTNYWLNAHPPAQSPKLTVSGNDLPSKYPITRSNDTLLNKMQISSPDWREPDNIPPPQSGQALKLPDKTTGQPPTLTQETPETPAAPVNARLVPQQAHSYSSMPVVSREQMQNLIRSAGDSLRDRD